ncbi:hypothetical protein [Streptomyces sp. NBC_00470]|uniref:hypothetical protein n=1 Tax=Streptomyces sp. NBC_00470 TaxID=2975753 RepID=UPI002F9107D0
MELIPRVFRDAETDNPTVLQWCSTVLAGDTARLLIVGPHWSGKSHTAFAALRRLLAAGYGEGNITVHKALELGRHYSPDLIEATSAVTVIDDLTVARDLVRERTAPAPLDPPETQALMALGDGARADAVARLVALPRRSWILVVSGIEALVETVGQESTDRLLAVADRIDLSPRPRPSLDW